MIQYRIKQVNIEQKMYEFIGEKIKIVPPPPTHTLIDFLKFNKLNDNSFSVL